MLPHKICDPKGTCISVDVWCFKKATAFAPYIIWIRHDNVYAYNITSDSDYCWLSQTDHIWLDAWTMRVIFRLGAHRIFSPHPLIFHSFKFIATFFELLTYLDYTGWFMTSFRVYSFRLRFRRWLQWRVIHPIRPILGFPINSIFFLKWC